MALPDPTGNFYRRVIVDTDGNVISQSVAGNSALKCFIVDGGSPTSRARVIQVAGDALGAQIALEVNARQLMFGGSGQVWSRERNNEEVTPLASAARTATTNSPDQNNWNEKGVVVFLDVTVNPGGAETLQVIIQARDPVTGDYVDLLDDGAQALGGNPGKRSLIVYPAVAAAAAGIDSAVGFPLPLRWRVRVVHSAGGSWTYSVGASYIR